MSTFSVPVVEVLDVIEHPNADRLSIIKVLGFTCISAKLPDGSPRYNVGDLVAYIPSAAVLPEWLLKKMDFWDSEKNQGTLSGTNGNRVKPMRLRGIFSEGVLFPALNGIVDANGEYINVMLGEDLSGMLGITKYEPPIPTHMAGEVLNLFGLTQKFDFERFERVPDLFEEGEEVVALEKIHGTSFSATYMPGLNNPELFGKNGDIFVHSKGLGEQGLCFKNNEANVSNLYVKNLNTLLDKGLEDRLSEYLHNNYHEPKSITVRGEIFGAGVQDLTYGTTKPEFRVFDIAVNGTSIRIDLLQAVCNELNLNAVPILYKGPFNLSILETHRDGKTKAGGDNIREGIVVRATSGNDHPVHGKKICKMISPDYLLRKAKNATEYQ